MSAIFRFPTILKVVPSARIIVADYNCIQVFDPNGKFLFKFKSPGSEDGQFQSPQGIDIDSKGRIFVADIGNGRIQVFDPNGKFLFKFGSEGSGDGQFVFPQGIAIDNSGRIFVADTDNNCIQVFDPNGKFLFKFGYPQGSGVDQYKSKPICPDAN
jgi:tripartite motif-containing protein 71